MNFQDHLSSIKRDSQIYVNNINRDFYSRKRIRMTTVGIPKLIHQTWKSKNLPQDWQPSADSWKRLHPEWQYHLWTDEENEAFIREKFPWFLETFLAFPYNIQRADAIRYPLLYEYGGVYSDADLEPMNNMDDLFPNKGAYIVTSNNSSNVYTNCLMASSPKEPIWLEIIYEMMKPPKWWYLGKHLHVMMTTGPLMIDRVAKRYPHTLNVLPSTTLLTCGVCDKMPCNNMFARARVLQGQSWNSWDSMVYNTMLCHWRKILILLILILLMLVIKKKFRRYIPLVK